ncbi:Ff.00g128920.m01.CDS01 [Fusarium sp. VM40]|nr:Ff.00g128920.m01.CDS01 [Fusarium sp. VM40]
MQNEGEDLQWGENTTWEYVNSSEFGPWTQQFGRVKSHGSETQHDCEIRMSLCFDALAHSPVVLLGHHVDPVNGYSIPVYLYWGVFNDVLNSTGSPALALRTIFTLAMRMAYYNFMPTMTPEDDLTSITTFEVVKAPQQTWGLTVVMAIVVGNVLAFLIVAFFFLYATDSSFIDNAWHTIAQISQSEDVKPILERAKLTSDKDVEEWLRGHEPSEGKIRHIKDFFRDIGRMFSQREPEGRYFVKNGVFTKADQSFHSYHTKQISPKKKSTTPSILTMSTLHFAKDQPQGFSNYIERVAIVGASGRQGSHIVEQLLKTGKHTITALTRNSSSSKVPEGVKIARVDYEDEESIAAALEGQQLLIITLANGVDAEVHHRIVRAAGKAGVAHIVPNIFAANIVVENKGAVDDFFPAAGLRDLLTEIERVGVSSWTVLVGSIWFDYSFPAGPLFMGFDLNNCQATLFDDGEAKVNTSTWAQYGRGTAALAGLKVLPEDENDASPTLAQFRNKPLYLSSFYVSQKDILASAQRVTNTSDADWDIKYETTSDRMEKGKAQAASGDFRGLVQTYYSFIFSPKGQKLNFEEKLHNAILQLPEEDLDEVVKDCVEKAKNGYSPF